MTLKILKAEDPFEVNQLVCVIYGAPGLGKTTLAFSAKDTLLLDFDHGAYRANVRGDSVTVEEWPDVLNITDEDMEPYKTIVVDTAGRALDFLIADIIKRTPKMGAAGSLTIRGYGALKTQFIGWLKMLRLIGKDVILVAHSTEEKSGDDILERLDITGGSKNEIYKSADMMGRLMIDNGKRVINFNPSDTAFGKNPGSLKAITVPTINAGDTVMADIITETKLHLNRLTEAQAQKQTIIHHWRVQIEEASTRAEFDTILSALLKEDLGDSGIEQTVKGALYKATKACGLVYTANGFVVEEAHVPEEEGAE